MSDLILHVQQENTALHVALDDSKRERAATDQTIMMMQRRIAEGEDQVIAVFLFLLLLMNLGFVKGKRATDCSSKEAKH